MPRRSVAIGRNFLCPKDLLLAATGPLAVNQLVPSRDVLRLVSGQDRVTGIGNANFSVLCLTRVRRAARTRHQHVFYSGAGRGVRAVWRLAFFPGLKKEYSAVNEKRTTFMTEDRTGFVWLYLQK